MDFESIPGVGEKTAATLASVEGAEVALETGDVATLAAASGISAGRAAQIARAAIRNRHGDDSRFLATDPARTVYRNLLSLLKERTATAYGAHRLETLYPTASTSRIDEVRGFAERAMTRDPDPTVLDALADVAPVRSDPDVTVRDRCLVTTDAERYARARDAVPELPVEVVDDARGLADLARGYSTVIALDEAFTGVEVDGDVRVVPDALDRPAEIVPERVLSFFAANRDSLRAAVEVHRAAGMDPACPLEPLESALEELDDDGSVVGDGELERLAQAIDDLDATVRTAEHVANDRLREAINERDVTIEGADLLSLAERGAGVDSILSRELADEYDAAVGAARDQLIDALDLTDAEAELAVRSVPEDPTFPIDLDESAIARLREDLVASRDRRSAERKRDLAARLTDLRPDAERLIRDALELDVELAIARFADDYGCTIPRFQGRGVAIEGGRSPLLDEPVDRIEPVDYAVEGVTLLTGVNSGGKTAALDLLASVVVLAHMGLPVPADDVRLQRFTELHYHAKTQGTLDAGAFEATLRAFAALADGDDGRLVLADELESITEPGASAKIMAGILEELDGTGATAVFVSHLADHIQAAADIQVAVDGIEATGLIDGALVVDRSPKQDHLARSTPELIVEKLAEEHGTPVYERLLSKFR